MAETQFDPNALPPGAERGSELPDFDGRVHELEQVAHARAAMHGPSEEDRSLIVEFYRHPVDGLDHIRMRIPGDKLYVPDFVADERYQARFPRQWAAYKEHRDQFEGQTLLDDIGWIDSAMKAHLAEHAVKTVEQLAGIQDAMLHGLGVGVRTARDKALEWINRDKATEELQARVAQQDAEMADMRAELEALKGQQAIAGKEAEQKRTRGK